MIAATAIAGCILSGGHSRRMGRDKAFVELGGTPLIAHATSRLQPQVARLIVSANGDPVRFRPFCDVVVADDDPSGRGPLAGILAAMRWTAANAPECTHVATIAVDTPFIPADLVERLAAVALPDLTILASSSGRVHPVVGLWPVVNAAPLADWLDGAGNLAVRAWTERCETKTVDFPVEAIDPFFNINTADDLAVAEAHLTGSRRT